jgi:Protein of unknown function (DUF3375)
MDFDQVEGLRRSHPAWRLLRADSAALVLSFLGQVFVDENVRSIPVADLASRLDDVLHDLNARLGEGTYPRSADAYLEDWARPDAAWLRKYYPTGSQVAYVDATADLERAYGWVNSLQPRDFVGTESRLGVALQLLEEITLGTESDPHVRLRDLERRREEIDHNIERARRGEVDVLDPTAVRERYQQFCSTARSLLADFREVEENFRFLDRQLRERVTAWGGSKGELLDDVLGDRASITDSDQGRTFHSFYDFLLSPSRQERFEELLSQVHAMSQLDSPDPRIGRIHHDWLEAGERTQSTVRLLSEQLRRFLDDRAWLENRRVGELLRSIEAKALGLRSQGQIKATMELDDVRPSLTLPMERPLYTVLERGGLDSANVAAGTAETDTAQLFEQVYVDPGPLALGIRRALQTRGQTTLGEILDLRALTLGLAELVTYLALDDPAFELVFDETIRQSVTWTDDAGAQHHATIPTVTYVRTGEAIVQ